MTHVDWILYILFFIGAFMLVLALATAFAHMCIWVIESGKHRPMSWHIAQAKKKRYNKITRRYK